MEAGLTIINIMPSKYHNAPIKEAVFDIKIDPVLGVNAKDIEVLQSKISDQYPIKEPFRIIETRIEVKEGKPIQTDEVKTSRKSIPKKR